MAVKANNAIKNDYKDRQKIKNPFYFILEEAFLISI